MVSGKWDATKQSLPNLAERKKLEVNPEISDEDDLGKGDPHNLNYLALETVMGDKQKLKSWKFARSNPNIKKQEQWPHMNLLRKYVKRCTFDSLDFEQYVAGESRTIMLMEDRDLAFKQLELLSRVAHWMCNCRDGVLVKGLFEAILESIEMGEETWFSDFFPL